MKLIRKLIVGISTICLLVMTFVSATYAWFEINSRASVENFHFEVHGGQGFQVSINDTNYGNSLTSIQLQKVMLVAYGDGEYRLDNDKEESLYHVSYDQFMNEILEKMTDDQIRAEVSNKIKLLPTTSSNGRELTDLYNSVSHVSTGRYVEFSVYFRTTSRREEDKFIYDIYLNGSQSTTDDGSAVEPTTITSVETDVPLSANMNAVINTVDGKYVKSLKRNNSSNQRDSIRVYSSNATRLSITENTLKEYGLVDGQGNPILDDDGKQKKGYRYELTDNNATKIYELNDTEHKNTDLGSYATDYAGGKTDAELEAMLTEQGTLLEDDKLALYCSKFNAMYTYYNNLKPDAQITHISYDTMPTTIKDLSGKQTITRLKSGDDAKLLTFRLWLEGWDADCFDGIKYAVKVKLAFGSKRVYE